MTKFCSIIIPFQDSQKTISKCLKSALNQVGNIDYDVILINDFSKDKSLKIIKKIIKLKKNCYLIKSKKNSIGPGHARNLGITKSKSKYVFFLDSDDYIKKNLLQNLFKLCEKKNFDLVCCNYLLRDFVGNFKKKNRFDLNLYNSNKNILIREFFSLSIIPQVISNLINRKILISNKIRFNNGFYEDIFFYFRVIFFSKKLGVIKQKNYVKNNINNSIVNSLTVQHIKFSFEAYYRCYLFLKKNSKLNKSLNIESYFMFAIVGQIAVFINRLDFINASAKSRQLIIKMLRFYFKKFSKITKIKYIFKTKKDIVAKNFIYN